jgi:phosphoribosylaminoimidazole-succinocarboxamide synthase
VSLPSGLRQADQLPEPIFTPSTKESSGHDQPISFSTLKERIGKTLAEAVRDKSLTLYSEAAAYAKSKGLILADTKFEFGIDSDQLVAADELLTPDSSRFWEASEYQPGRAQKSFDKQYLREWLETCDWDKTPPPPALPQAVIQATAKRYRAACERLTGEKCL